MSKVIKKGMSNNQRAPAILATDEKAALVGCGGLRGAFKL